MPYVKPKRLKYTLTACACALSLMGFASSSAARDDAAPQEPPSAEALLAQVDQAIARAKSTSGPGQPAMWTLSDDDTTIHIFGTVHFLRPDTKWEYPRIKNAFEAAQKVYFEADVNDPAGQASAQALIQQYGTFSDGGSLTALLDAKGEAVVAASAKKVGLSMAQIDGMKPWIVGLQISVMQIMQNGYDPQAGVDTLLSAKAKEDGKSFGFLETAETQLRALSGAPIEEQVLSLLLVTQIAGKGTEIVDLIVDEWSDRDVQGIASLIADKNAFGSEGAYNKLIVNRNQSWVPQIQAMLDQPGTVFVAVGAGHLAGPDSVITMLRDAGHTIAGPQ